MVFVVPDTILLTDTGFLLIQHFSVVISPPRSSHTYLCEVEKNDGFRNQTDLQKVDRLPFFSL